MYTVQTHTCKCIIFTVKIKKEKPSLLLTENHKVFLSYPVLWYNSRVKREPTPCRRRKWYPPLRSADSVKSRGVTLIAFSLFYEHFIVFLIRIIQTFIKIAYTII